MRGWFVNFSCVICLLLIGMAIVPESVKAGPDLQVIPEMGPYLDIWDDAGNNTNSVVVYNPRHDEYLVVWTTMQDQFSTDIWGRRLRGDGSPIPNGWFNIDNEAGKHLINPAIAYNSQTDQYLVVYNIDLAMDNMDIWGKIVNWNGVLSSRLYLDTSPQRQTDPAVVYNPLENQYLLGYSDWQSFSTVNLKLQTLNQFGGAVNSASVVSPANEFRGTPALAHIALDNHYLVVYGYEGSFIPRILGKSFSTTLGSLSPEYNYTDDGSGGMNPKIGCSPSGCLVTWNGLSGAGIKGRHIAHDGSSLGPSGGFEIAAPVQNIIHTASAVSLFQPWGYLTIWDQFLSISADQGDIYGSTIRFGENHPSGNGFPMDNRPYYEDLSSIACNLIGRCLLVNNHNPVQYPAGDFEISGRLVFSRQNFIPLIRH